MLAVSWNYPEKSVISLLEHLCYSGQYDIQAGQKRVI
jgi:hypothetical protein